MASRQLKLRKAVNKLAKYNGLYTVRDLAGDAAFRSTVGLALSNGDQSLEENGPSDIERQIIDLFINTSEGSHTSNVLIQNLINIANQNQDVRESLWKTFQVFYTQEKQNELYGEREQNSGDILSCLGISSSTQGNIINTSPNDPTKDSPGLSVVLSNSHRVGLVERDTNPSVIFLNSIPNVEMARATPFVDIKLSIGRPAKNSESKQIQTMSLSRFLVGAKKVEDGPLNDLVAGNQIFSGDPIDRDNNEIRWSQARATAGMELFTSPQTLVNANERDNQSLRSNPVLDKFRPLMSISNFEVTIVPSTGLMSYKTASLSLILHDRSRLAEVADFIRADLYGNTELTIEYGWYHPDGESTKSERNAYGDLINGMRIKEKYSILNSSFVLNEGGEMGIKLALFTRGAESFVTELISSDEGGTGNIIREIQDLQREVAELRSRIYGDGTGTTTREIRGVQILDAAQDALNHTTLTADLRTAMTEFRRALADSSNPNVSTLISRLNSMYGDNTRSRPANRRQQNSPSSTEPVTVRLRRSVQQSIAAKMSNMTTTPDPFLPSGTNRQDSARMVQLAGDRNARREIERIREANNIAGLSEGSTSLAKLLLLFVGQPIVNTGKYDDVQMIFYPFNSYAGKASKLNIGNFAVDNEFFAENFARWRLDRIGRSANVNLMDFVNFIGTTILDDPAAKPYGLFKDGKSLFEEINTEEGSNGTQAMSLRAIADPSDHLSQVEEILRGETPDGTFRPPQIDIYLEATPEKIGQRDGESSNQLTEKTILRIHVFDRLATCYDTLGSLLSNTRNTELASIGSTSNAPPVREGEDGAYGNNGVIESRVRIHNSFVQSAQAYGIIEQVPGTGDSTTSKSGGPARVGTSSTDQGPTMYRIRGGARELKKFLYKTMPYITYGTIGSNVKNANLSSNQEPQLNTINLLRSFRRSELEPNGENPGGIPMRIIPTILNLTTQGCPLIHFAQQYFVDFNTGTTADNIYGISGITHSFGPGEFTTGIKFAPLDAYGRYIGVIDQVRNAQAVLQDIEDASRTPS